MLIAVDFDHTLVDVDTPLRGAREAMWELRDLGHKILIHSCNRPSWIKEVLDKHDIPYDYIWGEEGLEGAKPNCDAYIDDRAIGFNGNWQDALRDLEGLEARRNVIKGLPH